MDSLWFEVKCCRCHRLILIDIPKDWNPYRYRHWEGEFYKWDDYHLKDFMCRSGKQNDNR